MRSAGLEARLGLWGLALVVLATWVCAAGHCAAQGLNPLGAASDSKPIDISADKGIEWDQNKQVYVARGNAVAIRGTSEVHADILTAHYRPSKNKSDGGNEVYRLDADGHVLIKAPNRTVVGDQAVYDVDQQIGVITGQNLKLTTLTDIVTARDSLEWYDQQQVAVARGDAVAIRGDRRIRADILTAHFIKDNSATGQRKTVTGVHDGKPAPGPATAKRAGPIPALSQAKPGEAKAPGKSGTANGPLDPDEGSTKISRVDAQGHVVVVTATDIGRGDYGVYNAQSGIVTLLGNVTITRGQDDVKGQYAVVDLNTNISRMMTVAAKPGGPPPRVEGLFYRQDANSGQGPNSGQAVNSGPKGAHKSSNSAGKSTGKPAGSGAPKS